MDVKNALRKIKQNIADKDSKTRYIICTSCEHFNSNIKTCMQCGCFMPAKTTIKRSSCPLGKW